MLLKTASLPAKLRHIIDDKATECPYTGKYNDFDNLGTYLCRRCGLALFRAGSKFHSGCGWPSFDTEIKGAVAQEPDADGQRTEILCSRCRAHLGHVFVGEGFTENNTRHCVNSASLDFINNLDTDDTEEAIFAAGCFWGVEYFFKQQVGVVKTEVGFIGGITSSPTYEAVCAGGTGHFEAIRVVYDPNKVSYEALTKYFFEIHDPTQTDGQGPDKGSQYLSAIFYYNDTQKHIAEVLKDVMEHKGYAVATKILPVTVFEPAAKYHQDYYSKTGHQPYCHFYQKKF